MKASSEELEIMRARIREIKSEFSKDEKFIATQGDIDFLQNSYDAIKNFESIKATSKQILKLLENCKNAFSFMLNKSLSAETIELCLEQYIKHLSGCSLFFLSEAFDNIAKTHKFFPSIAEILEAYEFAETENYNLWIENRVLINKSKISIMPRTKEFLKTVFSKPVEEKTERDIAYENFMRKNFNQLVQEVELERWNEKIADKNATKSQELEIPKPPQQKK